MDATTDLGGSRGTGLEVAMSLRSFDNIGAAARRYEEQGYDYLTGGEHVSFHRPMPNSLISLSVAAGATSSIRLLSAITLVPLYPPVLLAKMGAALDVASRGRFSLGVGVGGEYPPEFEACGVPVSERGARTNEALEIITRLSALMVASACPASYLSENLALFATEVLPALRDI